MSSICIIGAGHLGAQLANNLLLLYKMEQLDIALVDIDKTKEGEYLDLLGVAASTGDNIYFSNQPIDADVYVITAGKGRQPDQSKTDLYKFNRQVIDGIMAKHSLSKTKPIIIATNPPSRLADHYKEKGYNTRPFGLETDNLRAKVLNYTPNFTGSHEAPVSADYDALMSVKRLNEKTLALKGYTSFTPAIALAEVVLETLEGLHGHNPKPV